MLKKKGDVFMGNLELLKYITSIENAKNGNKCENFQPIHNCTPYTEEIPNANIPSDTLKLACGE